MRDLLAGAQHAREQISTLGLPDSYMVWVDIFLQPNQIVLVGFAIVMRFLIGLISGIFGGGSSAHDPDLSFLVPLRLPVQPLGLGQLFKCTSPRASASGQSVIGKPIPLDQLAVERNQRGQKV